MSLRFGWMAGAGLLAAVHCGAQVRKTPSGYLFRNMLVKGASYRYMMTSSTPDTKGQSGAILEIPVRIFYSEVQGDLANVQLTTGPTRVNGNQAAPETTTKSQIDNRNRERGHHNSGLTNLTGIVYPDKPIKIGETFREATVTPFPGDQAIKITGAYTLRAIQRSGTRQVAVINAKLYGAGTVSAAGQHAAARSDGAGTITVDMADGHVLTGAVTMKITIRMEGKPPITMLTSVTIERK